MENQKTQTTTRRQILAVPSTDLFGAIEACDYQCEAGPLRLSVQWQEVKYRIEKMEKALKSTITAIEAAPTGLGIYRQQFGEAFLDHLKSCVNLPT